MNKFTSFARLFFLLFNKKRVLQNAAALSYYMTMTIFPIMLVLYALLGNNYAKAMQALEFVADIVPTTIYGQINDFLNYVAQNSSGAMTVAGIVVVLTSSSAALRSIASTIGDIQGDTRLRGVFGYLQSFIISVSFVVAIYFAIIVMLTGKSFLIKLDSIFPFLDINMSWNYVRFFLLGGIMLVLFLALFEFSKKPTDKYNTLPGACFTTIAFILVSIIFSNFISASVNYSLVYGSLASIILLMFWLYIVCAALYCGATLNVCIRDFNRLERIRPH